MLILTLDAGGTNLVFNYVDNGIVGKNSTILETKSNSLDTLIDKIISGFEKVKSTLNSKIDAISFCFPGPADYKNGVIGNLENLPYFRGGVPLASIIENSFNVPTYINNDGDMFALGEFNYGFLSRVNSDLEKNGSNLKYSNLLGVTLGTGFGGGIVLEGKVLFGSNSAGGEINRMRSYYYPNRSCEEVISKRGLINIFKELSGSDKSELSPKIISEYARTEYSEYRDAAVETFNIFGNEVGNILANSLTLLDSPVVIGGGISNAKDLLIDPIIKALNNKFSSSNCDGVDRMEIKAVNYEDPIEREKFLSAKPKSIKVPNSDKYTFYNNNKVIPIGFKSFSTSKSIALGCYNFAIHKKNICS
ncbi:MAG: hypothetical protein CR982_10100 [Candidatus Cloacimonadota bacterium]|nr:MAG: hypothetical protein CR982_10100 [Candidatus Cloacimonadota bacterium]PIE77349.1 MAG: hypothetical protein CSA15_13410 [Candidatus Delongbacteria bacterium]